MNYVRILKYLSDIAFMYLLYS